jgi:N6-L-threonylcarbamoyladenine synthase
MVGTLAARTLAVTKNKPLYPIHHVEAHVYANFITDDKRHAKERRLVLPSKQPDFPMLALIVSGGHSQLVLFKDHGSFTLLGQTQDDAVGEAFDKVAKILGLSYPGGPSIAQAALSGDAAKYTLPKAKLKGKYDFSFSGLKTAVLRAVQREVGVDTTFPSGGLAERLTDVQRVDFAASFQRVAVQTLVDKAEAAFRDYSPASVVIAGGVAANEELRNELSDRLPIAIEYAPMSLCTDNAAMVASLGYYYAARNDPSDPYSLSVVPSLSMTKTAWAS